MCIQKHKKIPCDQNGGRSSQALKIQSFTILLNFKELLFHQGALKRM